MGKCGRLREEFHKCNLRLTYDYPDDFILHQWQSDSHVDPCYLIYRYLFFIVLSVLAYCTVRWNSNLPLEQKLVSLAYFTNWSFLLCMYYGFLGVLIVTKAYIKQHKGNSHIVPDFPRLVPTYWVAQNVVTELSFGVSITFWALVHASETPPVGRFTWALHIWNSSLLLMDFFIVAVPVRILHVYFSVVIGVVYSIFSYVYYAAGGKRSDGKPYVYKLLNWKDNPFKAAVMCLAAICFLLVMRVFMFGLFRLRVWIYYTYYDEANLGDNIRVGGRETPSSFLNRNHPLVFHQARSIDDYRWYSSDSIVTERMYRVIGKQDSCDQGMLLKSHRVPDDSRTL
ncbi:hypothetical protein ILUMI_09032 [Ignelater luminosus]|uniref:Protein rolling stone n=1 Tax=Ignelater luminosus TaxID=2038154 RepID=A0A8K0D0J6_IGNLU|nr:hypothetical protein ILUMI_09032 [Ignelater luminosus]